MKLRLNWGYVERLIALAIYIPLCVLAGAVKWSSESLFITALVAAGVIALSLSWIIGSRLKPKRIK